MTKITTLFLMLLVWALAISDRTFAKIKRIELKKASAIIVNNCCPHDCIRA